MSQEPLYHLTRDEIVMALGYVPAMRVTTPVNPFPPTCSTAILTRDSANNPTQVSYSLAGALQGYAHLTYDNNTPKNPVTVIFNRADDSTRLGNTITFHYDGATPPILTGVTNG